MLYSLQGQVTCSFPFPYQHVLRYWLERQHFEHIIQVEPSALTIKGTLTLEEIRDILVFCNAFATIQKGRIEASHNEQITHSFEVVNNRFYEYGYTYQKTNPVTQPLDYVVHVIQTQPFINHIDYTEFTPQEFARFETIISTFQHEKKASYENEFNAMRQLLANQQWIEIKTTGECIRWTNASPNTVTCYPYQKNTTPISLASSLIGLSSYTYDTKESRMVHWKGLTFPLHAIFLDPRVPHTITLPTGETVSPCSQCLFRLRRVKKMCSPCVPTLIPFNKNP